MDKMATSGRAASEVGSTASSSRSKARRTSSKLYRDTVEAEVAQPESPFGEVKPSPVTLLSIRPRSDLIDAPLAPTLAHQDDQKVDKVFDYQGISKYFIRGEEAPGMENGGVDMDASQYEQQQQANGGPRGGDVTPTDAQQPDRHQQPNCLVTDVTNTVEQVESGQDQLVLENKMERVNHVEGVQSEGMRQVHSSQQEVVNIIEEPGQVTVSEQAVSVREEESTSEHSSSQVSRTQTFSSETTESETGFSERQQAVSTTFKESTEESSTHVSRTVEKESISSTVTQSETITEATPELLEQLRQQAAEGGSNEVVSLKVIRKTTETRTLVKGDESSQSSSVVVSEQTLSDGVLCDDPSQPLVEEPETPSPESQQQSLEENQPHITELVTVTTSKSRSRSHSSNSRSSSGSKKSRSRSRSRSRSHSRHSSQGKQTEDNDADDIDSDDQKPKETDGEKTLEKKKSRNFFSGLFTKRQKKEKRSKKGKNKKGVTTDPTEEKVEIPVTVTTEPDAVEESISSTKIQRPEDITNGGVQETVVVVKASQQESAPGLFQSDQRDNSSYPIETEVLVQSDSEASPRSQDDDNMPLQTEHCEIILKTQDRPKSFTLPPGETSPRIIESNTIPRTHTETSSPVYETNTTPRLPASSITSPSLQLAPLSPNDSFDSAIARSSRSSVDSGHDSDRVRSSGHFVIVAVDFGTTFSGYAFSFTRDPSQIHMMRKWQGGDPGVINQKTPTSLLMTPDGKFHSFGFAARDFFHDLDPQEAKKWLYFEKFKMSLHYSTELNKDSMLKAINGKLVPAMTVFSHALRFFREHALQELSDQSATKILNEDVRWVITVPAIWRPQAKQFMRQAAYKAGIASAENPDQLLIALEPEAASIYVRRLRMHQLVPARPPKRPLSQYHGDSPETQSPNDSFSEQFIDDDSVSSPPVIPTVGSPSGSQYEAVIPLPSTESVGSHMEIEGLRYMVVDCGGGTVDITVHEMEAKKGNLKELYKATGGPYGSVGVDIEFEKLLVDIFGTEFIEAFKHKRPAGWVDLMIAFESRKRATNPLKNNPLNVSLPFSFIDYHKKYRGCQVEAMVRKYGDKDVRWSSQGMLRLMPDAMKRLFLPTLERIKQSVGNVLNHPDAKDVKYLFMVGGFADSPVLQYELRREFDHLLKILIPQDCSLSIVKGAVMFGLDPTVVNVRRSRLTYGVGVLNRYNKDKHPKSKLVKRDGAQWCTDVFDKFVSVDDSVALGDMVVRSYTPAKPGQKSSVINIYCAEKGDVLFITDPGVKKCGTLSLDLSEVQYQQNMPKRREIQTRMIFGGTEIRLSALDVASGKCVKATIDFLNK